VDDEQTISPGYEHYSSTGWQQHYNRREFWHYQFDEGLTWQAAMGQISDNSKSHYSPTNRMLS
jgi:hypothetical protein